ncbi:MAG TPA: TVP38/TMEM64 family protein [Candidatus Poseidoniaceae archaeon]|nr:MAG TPA: TVP38/TMEM64 family protein [Candidatus Poseidoniales archaeon]HII10448.1 TVP38/TMEM64 family protein [Candidatus Poseidoniaceae archaeon]|tara:strand:- start:5748 stop:6533 length:786 start_codon:yes stop_codon:yes gene_type:complete
MKRLASLPKPAEMQLIDGKVNLQQMKENQPQLYRWRALFGAVMLIGCAGAGYVLFQDAQVIISWFEDIGPLGPILYALAVSLGIVLLIPSPLLKVAAGAIFPFWVATLVNYAASMIGGMIAFLLGRWLFRDTIQASIADDEKMKRIERALAEDAMRISILVRLSPLIPDEWLNYMMSAGPVSFRVFMLSNASSIIYSLAYAYYGHALGSFALNRNALQDVQTSTSGSLMLGLGIMASILATVFVTRASMRALSGAMSDESE